ICEYAADGAAAASSCRHASKESLEILSFARISEAKSFLSGDTQRRFQGAPQGSGEGPRGPPFKELRRPSFLPPINPELTGESSQRQQQGAAAAAAAVEARPRGESQQRKQQQHSSSRRSRCSSRRRLLRCRGFPV
ncbi:hypothetical protein ETH_00036395, partial [Eimeria tenella]